LLLVGRDPVDDHHTVDVDVDIDPVG